MGAVVVGERKQLEIHTVAKVKAGEMSFKEALDFLQISERTLRRWLRSFDKQGIAFINHGNKGKAPANKLPADLKKQVMLYMQEDLYDFNMLHALEKIEIRFNLKINRETFRRWCHEIGMVKQAHHVRRGRPRYKRTRHSRAGFMLQMDGSPHRWFEGEECCLIAAIDDATSEILRGEFFPTESMMGTFSLLTAIFEKHGLPSVIYVDRAGIYGGQKRTNFSQLVRALDELGIQIIYANSPEGKGRVERMFKTLQDRLIPEMRLAGIKERSEATKYMNEIFLPHLHNPRFAVQPQSLKTAWRPLLLNQKLKDIFCIKEKRRVARDHTFNFEGDKYLITTDLKYSIYNHDLELRFDAQGAMRAIFAGRDLDYKKIVKCPQKMAA
jgi:transposase